MRTRPVFESYTEFVNSLYHPINEATDTQTFDVFIAALGTFIDEESKNAFTYANDCFQKSGLQNKAAREKGLQQKYAKINQRVTSLISANNKESSLVKNSGKFTADVQRIYFGNMINGKIALKQPFTAIGKDGTYAGWDSVPYGREIATNSFINPYDVISYINAHNLNAAANTSSPSLLSWSDPDRKQKKIQNQWTPNEKGEVANTGIGSSAYITKDLTTSILWQTGAADLSSIAMPSDKAKGNGKTTEEKQYRTFFLYNIENMKMMDEKASALPVLTVMPTLQISESVPEEPVEVPIQGTDAMFKQGESQFNTDAKGEELLKAALANALSGFSSIKSIEIIGGASYEGKDSDGNQGPKSKINQTLVDSRAQVVANSLKALLGKESTIQVTAKKGDYSKIQPTNDPGKYPTYRKVYLMVKGNKKGNALEIPIDVEKWTERKAGSFEIVQYTISIEYFSDKLKLPGEGDKKKK